MEMIGQGHVSTFPAKKKRAAAGRRLQLVLFWITIAKASTPGDRKAEFLQYDGDIGSVTRLYFDNFQPSILLNDIQALPQEHSDGLLCHKRLIRLRGILIHGGKCPIGNQIDSQAYQAVGNGDRKSELTGFDSYFHGLTRLIHEDPHSCSIRRIHIDKIPFHLLVQAFGDGVHHLREIYSL